MEKNFIYFFNENIIDENMIDDELFEKNINNITIEPSINECINLYNHNFIQYYLKLIYDDIINKINEENNLFNLEYLNDYNMIFIHCKFQHIIDFGSLAITFNYEYNEYVLSLMLYNVKNMKIKKLDIRISSLSLDSDKIIKSLNTISEYILYDYLYVKFS